jgi:F0F1-type ATP synthase alpha subunit
MTVHISGSIAFDTIMNVGGLGVMCFYVAIGLKV